jgi:ferredoxin
VADGLLGKHRVLAPLLGPAYAYFIGFFEILALGVILSCVSFLWRRNVVKVNRFHKREMKGWPSLDANLILVIEIALVGSFLLMNAADLQLQSAGKEGYVPTGPFVVSSLVSPLFSGVSDSTLVAIERGLWWFHILGILFFLNYVTYSKHLHIMMAFPNTFYGDLDTAAGKMKNMPEVQAEVALMMDPEGAFSANAAPPPERFGAQDVGDLSWKNILDAYSCTECGRCTAVCPANKTGKLLSPRKIMMDTRDRAEVLGRAHDRHGPGHHDGKHLLGNYISQEELLACTTCNACVEECPVNINPLDIILQMRRHLVMDQAQAPAEWNSMFSNVENNMAPWAFPASDRFAWANNIPTANQNKNA